MTAESEHTTPPAFTFIGPAPLMLLYALMAFGALLSTSIALGESAARGGAAGTAALAGGLLVFPIAVMIGLHQLVRSESRWLRKGLYLYLALDLLVLGFAFALLLGLGGASMAAAEGTVSGRLVAENAVMEAVIWLVVAQVLIVPWAVGVTYLARRRARSG